MEKSKINIIENGGGTIFPYNFWKIEILSSDVLPNFHIKRNGWNVSFNIETGEIMEVIQRGEEKNVLDYMKANVKQWLDSPSAILPTITNRENANIQWIQIHG